MGTVIQRFLCRLQVRINEECLSEGVQIPLPVKNLYTNDATQNTQKLKLAKNTFTVGTWNMQTLWAAGKLELLRNEMKRFKYDIIGISEVRWTGKSETPQGDFIGSGEETSYIRSVGFLLSKQAQKALIGYNPISSRIISARFDAAPF